MSRAWRVGVVIPTAGVVVGLLAWSGGQAGRAQVGGAPKAVAKVEAPKAAVPDEGIPPADRLELARQAYKQSFDAYRAGRAGTESPYLWSQRLLLVGIESNPVETAALCELHLTRMKQLEALARTMTSAGQASALDLSAVGYYRGEAEKLLAVIRAGGTIGTFGASGVGLGLTLGFPGLGGGPLGGGRSAEMGGGGLADPTPGKPLRPPLRAIGEDDKSKALAVKLDQVIPMDFSAAPLQDVLDHIKLFTTDKGGAGIPIYVDPTSLEDAGGLIAPVTLQLEGVALKTALRLALSQHDLTYIVRDGVLIITSPDDVARMDAVVTDGNLERRQSGDEGDNGLFGQPGGMGGLGAGLR